MKRDNASILVVDDDPALLNSLKKSWRLRVTR